MSRRPLPPWIRCPLCKGALEESPARHRCGACRRDYPTLPEGIADLRVDAVEAVPTPSPSARIPTDWDGLCGCFEVAGYRPPVRGRFLDLGAASAPLLRQLGARFDEVVSIAAHPDPLQELRDALGAETGAIAFVLATPEHLPVASRSVRCFHLDAALRPRAELDGVLGELHRVLEPEGIGLARYRLARWPGDGRPAMGAAPTSAEVARASRHAFQDGHRILTPGSRLGRWLPARWEPPRMLQALVQFEYSSRRRGSRLSSALRAVALRSASRADVVYERVRGDAIDWIQPTTSDDPFSFGRFYHADEEVPGSD